MEPFVTFPVTRLVISPAEMPFQSSESLSHTAQSPCGAVVCQASPPLLNLEESTLIWTLSMRGGEKRREIRSIKKRLCSSQNPDNPICRQGYRQPSRCLHRLCVELQKGADSIRLCGRQDLHEKQDRTFHPAGRSPALKHFGLRHGSSRRRERSRAARTAHKLQRNLLHPPRRACIIEADKCALETGRWTIGVVCPF